jgi:hypothetical protein
MIEKDRKENKAKNTYQVPPDLASAILSFVDWENAATTSTICKYIASSNSTFLGNPYAKSTVRKAINALKNTNEIEVYVKQSKRLKKDYIYCITEKGKQMISHYVKVQQTINLANYDYDEVQKELVLLEEGMNEKELNEQSLMKEKVNEQTTGVLESVECDLTVIDALNKLAEVDTANRENQTEMESYDTKFPFVEKNPIITEHFEGSSETGHDHSKVIKTHVNERMVRNLERQIDQTISVDEMHELEELGSTVLSDVEKEIAVLGVNEQATEVLEPVECVIVSKSRVCIEDEFYAIPPNITIISIRREKNGSKDKLYKGQIITDESNDENWVFQYKGNRHLRPYDVRVKINPRHLTVLNEPDKLVEEDTANKDGQIKMASYKVKLPSVEENPTIMEHFEESSDHDQTKVMEAHVNEGNVRNQESENDQTINVDETNEPKELGSTVLSDIEKETVVIGVNEQTTGVLESEECVIISKSKICIKEKFYSIPPNIEIISIIRKKASGKDQLFKGQIITEESNDEKWIFQYKGEHHSRYYNVRVKIDPRYLTVIDKLDKIAEEDTVNKENQTVMASHDAELPFVNNNTNNSEYFEC